MLTNIKSKTFAGLMVALSLFVGVVALNVAATPAHADTINIPTTGVKKTSGKEAIKNLQMFLNWTLDGSITPLVVDGIWGSKTMNAVKQYQAANGLTVDGIFGKMSAAKAIALLASGGGNMTTGGSNEQLCPNGMTLASNCTLPPSTTTTTQTLCPNGMTLASNCTVAPTTGGTTPVGNGPLAVMLSSDNPASGSVVAGQALADLAHFTFSGSGTLTQVSLQRTGLSTSADITAVYLFDGNVRLSEAASVNTNGQIIFNGLNIPVTGSKNIAVKADLASSGFSSVSLGVTLTGYMVSGGTTATTVSLAGNIMSASSAPSNIATLTLNSQSASADASVDAGSTQYAFWSGAMAVSGRTALLKGANFKVIGSAPVDALKNVRLFVDGTQAGSDITVGTNGYAFFDFSASPITLTTGSHTIDVRADIEKGSNRTVQFSIQNGADLLVEDSQLGINVALGSSGLSSYGNAGTITINAGSVTTTVDPTFQAMTNVTGGATNAVIGRFIMHAYGEDVKVNTLAVVPAFSSPTLASGSCTQGTDCSLNNVTLYLNGAQVGSSQNLSQSSATTLTFTLGSSLILPAGVDSILEVRADLQNASNVNYTGGSITAQLTLGSNNAQGMNSLLNTIDVPSATIVTSGLTMGTGQLSVAKNTAVSNQSISPGTTGATIGSFVLQNQSSSESVRVTNLAVGLVLTSVGSTNYSNLKTDESSGSGSTPINPATAAAAATSSNNFSVNFTLAPGATKIINVMTDVSTATGSLYVTFTPTAIGVNSNVNVTPSAVSGQTITVAVATFGTPSFISSGSTVSQFIAAAGGNTDGSVARFNLTSSNGAATVSEAKFAVRGTSTTSGLGTVASVRLGSVSAPIVLATTDSTTLAATMTSGNTVATVASGTGIANGSILVIDSEQMLVGAAVDSTHWAITRGYNGTTAAAHDNASTVSVQNGVAYFTGLNLSVPNNSSGINLDVYPTYSSVGTNGITSSSASTLSLSYLKYTTGNTTKTACVTSLSCTDTSSLATEVSANNMTVVGSKPTLSIATPSATLAAASTAAIDVTVSADAKGDITLVTLPITVGLTGASVSTSATHNISVYAGSDLSTDLVSSNTAFAGATGGSSTITFTNSGYRIAAGTSVTFHIYVTIVGMASAASGSNSMATSLTSGTGFSWADTAGGGSTTSGTSSVYGYPTGNAVIRN